jgi:hypothetical protein
MQFNVKNRSLLQKADSGECLNANVSTIDIKFTNVAHQSTRPRKQQHSAITVIISNIIYYNNCPIYLLNHIITRGTLNTREMKTTRTSKFHLFFIGNVKPWFKLQMITFHSRLMMKYYSTWKEKFQMNSGMLSSVIYNVHKKYETMCCQVYKLISQYQSKDGDMYFNSSFQHIQHTTSSCKYVNECD